MSVFAVVRTAAMAVAILLGVAIAAAHADDEIQRGPAPAWVIETAAPPPTVTPGADGGLRILSFDTQSRIENDRQLSYVRTRSVASSPEGLAMLGNISLVWEPSVQEVIVHHVNIARDGETTDVLASQEFQILRREEQLEQAVLDGRLTALLQPSGLRAGDVLDVAYTVVSRFPVPNARAEQAIDLNMPFTIDHMRYRASWPTGSPVEVRAANDWTELPVRRVDGYSAVEVVRDGAEPVPPPVDLPARLQRLNLVEFSGYRDWSEVAAVLEPLYGRARRLGPDSPLNAEIARIRALSDDPAVQAAAALRLVQDQVRYVALLMGEGGLTPATADETWTRRFGDCKAKTALLLALLDGLGFPAEAAAVSLLAGDGMDERLPGVGVFDHVLVRAVVGGRTYWLDGTQQGDRALEHVSPPPFHWALPLVASGGRLEALTVSPRHTPDNETILAFDASDGRFAPVSVTGTSVFRGQAGAVLAGQIGLAPAALREQGLKDIWAGFVGDGVVTEVNSVYNAETAVLTLSMTGSTRFDWPDSGLILPGSTYAPLSVAERPDGPFRDAPYAIAHPSFSRQVATLKLPDDGRGFSVEGGAFDRTEFGHQVSRTADLDGDTVTIEVRIRSLQDEVSATQARVDLAAAEARVLDRPKIFSRNAGLTEADRTAMAAAVPTTGGGWLDRAFALSGAGDHQGALAAANKAVELSPESSSSWANRGVYRFWTGDLEGAASDIEKAVDIDPSERIAMNGAALLAMSEGRDEDAVIEMSRALRQKPGDAFALEMRARAYETLGQYDRMLRDINSLMEQQPDNVPLKLRQIGALEMAGRTDEADAAMAALAAANPDNRAVLINQAALKQERDKPQEATDILDRVIARWPDNALQARAMRAGASIALNRLDAAAEDMDAVRRANLTNAEVLNDLCWSAALEGVLLDQGLKDCDAALALSPDTPAYMDSKARVLLQMGRPDAALDLYDAALTKVPEQSASLYGRGLARIALGQTEAGEADKKAALVLDPEVASDFESYHRVATP